MNNKEILEMNNGKKFDIVLMNPPYGAKEDGNYLDIKFANKILEISDKQITVMPAKLSSNAGIYKSFFNDNHIKDIELLDPHKAFNINPFGAYKYVGIYTINSNETFDKLHLTLNNKEYVIENDLEHRSEFINNQTWDEDIRKLIKKYEDLRQELFDKYKSMVNDGHGFIYEENRLQRGKTKFNVTKKDNHSLDRVKQYLKDKEYKYCIYKGSGNNSYDKPQEWLHQDVDKLFKGQVCWLTNSENVKEYKYCIYKGSGNHSYDKPQEWLHQDVDKLFKGQVCWLTNSENVKDNIIYWMETPIFDLWRTYYFNHSKYTVGCMYGHLPALDFEMAKNKFKEYVNSLNKFDKEDIKVLKKYNIHNSDNL